MRRLEMDVHWLEQSVFDVPLGDEWLSASERRNLAALHFPKRRRDWRLGRWTAKSAVGSYLSLRCDASVLAAVEVRPTPSGAPEVFLQGRPAPVTVSLSHSEGIGLCVISSAHADVGCDLEKVAPRSPAFVTDYFTGAEQQLVAQITGERRDRVLTLLWSAKESALKAMRCGLREDTRSVHAIPELPDRDFEEWQRLTVRHVGGGSFSGWWRESDDLVRTVVVGAAIDHAASKGVSSPSGHRLPDGEDSAGKLRSTTHRLAPIPTDFHLSVVHKRGDARRTG